MEWKIKNISRLAMRILSLENITLLAAPTNVEITEEMAQSISLKWDAIRDAAE